MDFRGKTGDFKRIHMVIWTTKVLKYLVGEKSDLFRGKPWEKAWEKGGFTKKYGDLNGI